MAIETVIFKTAQLAGLTVDLYPIGSDTAVATGLTATEETNRDGVYTISTDITAAGEYVLIIKQGTLKVGDDIALLTASATTSRADSMTCIGSIKSQTDKVGGSVPLAATQNVAQGGTITVVAGDDHTGARALVLPVDGISEDLTAADLTFGAGYARDCDSRDVIVADSVSVVDNGGGSWTFTIEISQEQTDATPTEYAYQIQAAFESDKPLTRVAGTMYVNIDRNRPELPVTP